MKTLAELAASEWNVEEFVEEANKRLPLYLPQEVVSGRLRENVTPRLVRHYAMQGMLDPPLKSGNRNRYAYRHLLQILVLRKLQAEGYTGTALEERLRLDDEQLELILEGRIRTQASPENPALAYMQGLKQQADTLENFTLGILGSDQSPRGSSRSTRQKRWLRLEVEQGLELFIRDDYRPPGSPREKELLLQHIASLLEESRRK